LIVTRLSVRSAISTVARSNCLMVDAPVIRLVNAILLSSVKKGASAIRIRHDGTRSIVEFLIDGVAHEEMGPPVKLHAPIIRRLSIMANLPMYAKGEAAVGYIHLSLGGDRHAYFAVRVEGHGDGLEAQLRAITAAEMP
jgi:type II secretory ATPase GspE/PulE/Tfp pilus assembly ATPase PilB-like protein